MATDKQIAANRANALKSTGPRTPEGKLVSSLNNTRHGMLARSVLIRGESPERFRAMLATFYSHFRPSNAAENGLVDTFVAARWRQMRLQAIDSAAINLEIDRQSPADTAYNAPTRAHLAMRALSGDTHHAQNVHRVITRNDRQVAATLDKLLRLKHPDSGKKNSRGIMPPGYVNPEPDFSSGFLLAELENPEDYFAGTNPISDTPDEAPAPEQPE